MNASIILDRYAAPATFYNYSVVFEPKLDHEAVYSWLNSHIYVSFLLVTAYLFIVFGGQLYMKNRTPFDLKWVLIAWNTMLCLFALIGLVRTMPDMVHTLKNYGFFYSVCRSTYVDSTVTFFWMTMFMLSKIPELVDTFFIVFRKRRLIFLHWYHHVTVLLFSWAGFAANMGPSRYYVVMNFFAHSMVYLYYTLKTMDIEVPVFLAAILTSSQILQMVVGCYVTYYAYFMRRAGYSCDMPDEFINYGLLLYSSYLLLFINYFYHTYISPSKKALKQD